MESERVNLHHGSKSLDILFSRNVTPVEEMNSVKTTEPQPSNESFVASSMAELRRHLQEGPPQTPAFSAQPLLTLATPSWNWLPHAETGSSSVPS